MKTVVLATANLDKAAEIRKIVEGLEILPRPDDIPDVDETASSLEENARIKARAIVEATGLPAMADDTGLEVDALGGLPGVRSARYAGDNVTYADNVAKMLREMTDVKDPLRTAKFRTVALLLRPDGHELVAEGVVLGRIAPGVAGDGWGYDPIFVPDEGDGRSFAEMSSTEKNAISHRGRAFRQLSELIERELSH